jgi:transposase
MYYSSVRLRINKIKRGKSVLEYAQIVQDYVEEGKEKTKIVKHLGRIRSDTDLERYRKMFALEKQKDHIARADLRNLDIKPPREYGMIYASQVLCHDLGIDQVFEILGEYSEIIFLSVISRIISPSSDIALLRISEKVQYTVQKMSKDRIYAALDRLIEKKDEIEESIVKTLKPDMRRVYYDLTSTYFEGKEKNDLVMFGYSRDKKRGKKQINIGLMMADGIPIHHQVFPGNTIDPKTLRPISEDLRHKFHVRRVIFIGDRAFGRKPSLQYMDKNEYITAVYRWDQPYRSILASTEFSENDCLKDIDLYAREVDVKWNVRGLSRSEIKRSRNRRAVAVYSPEREKEDIADMEEKVSIVKSIIDSGKKGSDLINALGKLRSCTISNGTSINEKKIADMKKIAGRFMIVSDTDLSITDMVKGYKDLWRIERSFRTIKSFLEIRPVYHRKEERIEAHVFVCVLSLLISRLFEKAMDEKMTISSMADALSELKAIPVMIPEGEIVLRSESDNARKILESMKIPYPGKILDSVPTK